MTSRRPMNVFPGASWLIMVLLVLNGHAEGTSGMSGPAPNVLLVTMDTTRADRIGCYGYERGTTPALDALAREGVVFEQCFSQVPITLPSHTSILSSRTPASHGVRDNGIFTVPQSVLTLPEILKPRGYATGAVVASFVLDSRFGLQQGFDTYNDAYTEDWTEEEIQQRRIYAGMILERKADLVYQAASAWLASAPEPFFLWTHFFDPHQPLNPPQPWLGNFFDDLYDAEIAFTDEYIGQLLAALKVKGVAENTLIIVTGDHGEGLDDHGEPTHAMLLYDSTLHVPLIMRLPKAQRVTGRVPDMVRSIDIAPTVLDVLGVDIPPDFEGVSLLPRMQGKAGPLALTNYHENLLPHFSFGWSTLRGWRADGWVWIEAPSPLLYHYEEDPEEVRDLIRAYPGRAARMRKDMHAYLAGMNRAFHETDMPLDPEAVAALEALGYAGGVASAVPEKAYGKGADPNARVSVQAAISVARHAVEQGDVSMALASLSEIEAMDPGNIQLYALRAKVHLQRGAFEEAAKDLDRAVNLSPKPSQLLLARGHVAMGMGDFTKAREFFDRILRDSPKNVSALYQQALCSSRLGDHEAAADLYKTALAIDPSHIDSRINLGIALARLKRLDQARDTLERARRWAPYSARLIYNLGTVRYHLKDWSGARDAFSLALRSHPDYPEALLGMAAVLHELDEQDAAVEQLKRIQQIAPQSKTGKQARSLLAQCISE